MPASVLPRLARVMAPWFCGAPTSSGATAGHLLLQWSLSRYGLQKETAYRSLSVLEVGCEDWEGLNPQGEKENTQAVVPHGCAGTVNRWLTGATSSPLPDAKLCPADVVTVLP